jgi:nucleotide-binding universal stress UspA family protein
MAKRSGFQVVVGTDGSRTSIAAIVTTLAFPWPDATHVAAVVARRTPATAGRPRYVVAAYDRHWGRVAASAKRALGKRWPEADVSIADASAADAILDEAKRRGADVIVLGWRGHGAFRRMLMGSVSRSVVRGARCSVLVTRRRLRGVRRVVVGVDGSPNSRRAVELIARLDPGRGAEALVVYTVEPMSLPSIRLMPTAIQRVLRKEGADEERERISRAERALASAAQRLRAAGWKTRTAVRKGAPLAELLSAAGASEADVLVIGARGAGEPVKHAVLGSVAEGALARASLPVLIAR